MSQETTRGENVASYGSSTVDKAIDVLVAVASANGGLSNAEISESLALDRSTTHRLVATLERRGLVVRGNGRKFTSGSFLHLLAFGSPLDLRVILAGILDGLVERTGESASFSIPQGDRFYCVVNSPSPNDLRYCPSSSKTYSLNSGATGLAIWAFLPKAVSERLLTTGEMVVYTDATIIDRDLLRTELEKTRERGYAMSAGSRTPGGCAIASPVMSHQGALLGAITISAADVRLPLAKLTEFHGDLQNAAQSIAERLGTRDA